MVKSIFLMLALSLMLSCAPSADGTTTTQGSQLENRTEIEWNPSLSNTVAFARQFGRMVLMFAGRPTCGNCSYMKNTVCEMTNQPDIKGMILSDYETAFIDVDASTEWHAYAYGLGSFTLPLICIIDPDDDPGEYIERKTGVQDADYFYSLLSNYR